MVKQVTYFVHEEFNTAAYDSCKNVQYPEVGRPPPSHPLSYLRIPTDLFFLLKPLGLVYTNNLTSGGKNGGTGLIPSP
jgi:hypothetical protein